MIPNKVQKNLRADSLKAFNEDLSYEIFRSKIFWRTYSTFKRIAKIKFIFFCQKQLEIKK